MSDTQLQFPRRMLLANGKLYHYQYIAFAFIFLLFHSVLGEPCNFDADPCICTTKNFQLNLKSFMEARKGEDLQINGENTGELYFTYYVQPCNRKLSHQIPACITVSPELTSCQVLENTTIGIASGLGLKNMFNATQDQDNFILTNSFIQKPRNINRTLHLTVKCSNQEMFTYDGSSNPEFPPIIYKFTLATSHVCPRGNKGGLSPGSIMVIIFFVLVIVYLLGGLLFQKFVRKAQGAEIVPNYIFWREFPFLVKDGVLFTFQCCKGSSGYGQVLM